MNVFPLSTVCSFHLNKQPGRRNHRDVRILEVHPPYLLRILLRFLGCAILYEARAFKNIRTLEAISQGTN